MLAVAKPGETTAGVNKEGSGRRSEPAAGGETVVGGVGYACDPEIALCVSWGEGEPYTGRGFITPDEGEAVPASEGGAAAV